MTKILCLALSLVSVTALAQSQGSAHRPDSFVGGGVNQFEVISPSSDMKMTGGAYITLTAEKPFGQWPVYLDAQVNYMHGSATVNYNYLSPTNIDYIATGVNGSVDFYNANLGIKVKFLEDYLIKPYLEVGGIGGYMQLAYDNSLKTPAVVSAGSDFKSVDGSLNFGVFTEAGLEVAVTNSIGAVVAYKYMDSVVQPIATVKNQLVHYTGNTYYGALVFKY